MGAATKGLALAIVLATRLFPVAAQESDAATRSIEEVRLPGLAIGRTFSTWRLAQAPLVVRNPGSDTLRVRVEIVLPARHELRPGARAVPDRTWLALESREVVVPPHGEHRTDVRLTLPYDPDLAGYTYQVDLVCAERSSGAWSARARHRLLFSVEMDYRDDTEVDLALHVVNAGASL